MEGGDMRIIGGLAKGRRLRSLKGTAFRPTMDKVRESVFSILGPRVEGSRFLDIYAGVGTAGLEALSRGATEATFVESHRPAGKLIQENAELCGFGKQARVIMAQAAQALARLRRESQAFDIVFADPPYGSGEVGAVMSRLGQWPEMVAEGGVLVLQRSRFEDPGETAGGLVRVRSVRFGETVVDYYRRKGSERGG